MEHMNMKYPNTTIPMPTALQPDGDYLEYVQALIAHMDVATKMKWELHRMDEGCDALKWTDDEDHNFFVLVQDNADESVPTNPGERVVVSFYFGDSANVVTFPNLPHAIFALAQ